MTPSWLRKAVSVLSVDENHLRDVALTWTTTIEPFGSGGFYALGVIVHFPPGSVLTGCGRPLSISTVRFQITPMKRRVTSE